MLQSLSPPNKLPKKRLQQKMQQTQINQGETAAAAHHRASAPAMRL